MIVSMLLCTAFPHYTRKQLLAVDKSDSDIKHVIFDQFALLVSLDRMNVLHTNHVETIASVESTQHKTDTQENCNRTSYGYPKPCKNCAMSERPKSTTRSVDWSSGRGVSICCHCRAWQQYLVCTIVDLARFSVCKHTEP